ncbi:MAG: hypothetical protein ABI906_02795 [Pseudomonadota bacterium]
MCKAFTPVCLAWCLALAGCATPGVLKRPLAGPTMAPPAEPNPIPAYATRDPSPHPAPQGEPSAPP